MKDLFERFIKEKEYIVNVSPHTVRSYRQAFAAWERLDGELSKEGVFAFVVALRQTMAPGGANVYIRSLNSFFSWLHENGHTPERYTIPRIHEKKKLIPIFTDEHIDRILKFKPKDYYQHRLWVMCCTLLDTGIRIQECINLKRSDVDWDNLLLSIVAKGKVERRVPFSNELRKILYHFLKRRDGIDLNGEWLFPTTSSTRVVYRNFYRDMVNLCHHLRIEGARVSPHGFRHYFAANFIRQGGEVYTLSRLLGHSAVTVTEVYLQSLGLEYFQQTQAKFTPLSRR